MTQEEFTRALKVLSWSTEEAARRFGFDRRQIYRFAKENAAIPTPVAAWLAAVVEWFRLNPPPQGRGLTPMPDKTRAVARHQSWDRRLGNAARNTGAPAPHHPLKTGN